MSASALVLGRLLAPTINLSLNGFANELRATVRADEFVNLLQSLFRQADEDRLIVQRWPPHALRISRYRKLSQIRLLMENKRYHLIDNINDIVYNFNHKPIGGKEMTARYALRMEIADSTILDAYHHMDRKADAIAAACRNAKDIVSSDIVRIWVEDTKTKVGVKSFDTRGWKKRRETLIWKMSQ